MSRTTYEEECPRTGDLRHFKKKTIWYKGIDFELTLIPANRLFAVRHTRDMTSQTEIPTYWYFYALIPETKSGSYNFAIEDVPKAVVDSQRIYPNDGGSEKPRELLFTENREDLWLIDMTQSNFSPLLMQHIAYAKKEPKYREALESFGYLHRDSDIDNDLMVTSLLHEIITQIPHPVDGAISPRNFLSPTSLQEYLHDVRENRVKVERLSLNMLSPPSDIEEYNSLRQELKGHHHEMVLFSQDRLYDEIRAEDASCIPHYQNILLALLSNEPEQWEAALDLQETEILVPTYELPPALEPMSTNHSHITGMSPLNRTHIGCRTHKRPRAGLQQDTYNELLLALKKKIERHSLTKVVKQYSHLDPHFISAQSPSHPEEGASPELRTPIGPFRSSVRDSSLSPVHMELFNTP